MEKKSRAVAAAAKRIAALGVLTAMSLVTFIIENQFPPLFVPGAKMGLANVFSFAALILFTPLEAFAVLAVRTLLGAVFAGNISAVIYSFSGGAVSLFVSAVLLYLVHPKVSVMAISVLAAVCHNVTQNAVFCLMTGSTLAFAYAPYLVLLGILAGAIVGGIILIIFKKVPRSVFAGAVYGRKAL